MGRDTDILVVKQSPPHRLFLNDRLWRYTESEEPSRVLSQPLTGLAAADSDTDGHIEFFGLVPDRGLLRWSLEQDRTGEARCTYKMRLYSYWGIFVFAITTTLAAVMWMKALQHQWFSTMYGVWYFAGSVWLTSDVA